MISLEARVPLGAAVRDPGAILDRFLSWVSETGLVPYPAQEEAILQLMADLTAAGLLLLYRIYTCKDAIYRVSTDGYIFRL